MTSFADGFDSRVVNSSVSLALSALRIHLQKIRNHEIRFTPFHGDQNHKILSCANILCRFNGFDGAYSHHYYLFIKSSVAPQYKTTVQQLV